ncbi:hypothetical protein AURDEDRAFT_184405 [Auricularia subglabra TFB-10046 SS5]|nr:hypothetical protein AURDEDRAFT_184405 [Auricularia subglabra TFB-10046 SS5]
MAAIADEDRTLLLNALVDQKPFYGEGVWTFPSDQLNLFIREDPWCLSLRKDAASVSELEKLAAGCKPATFGVNEQDVLDESYRKAGKLDRNDFSLNLDVVSSGLLRTVKDSLFSWEESPRGIKAELYKLNVYGTGSFFKPHKDTPRGDDMFGSLVINFPTQHEGGALVLRHDGHGVVHDASQATYTSDTQVSWVAFYSDVEHEVLPVKSGHRVTLTYNLYFEKKPLAVSPTASSEPLLAAFTECLGHASFLPEGGRLGFGLKHQYPVPSDVQGQESRVFLDNLSTALKGVDAALYNACRALNLHPKLFLAYATRRDGTFLLDYIYEGGHWIEDWNRRMEQLSGEKIAFGEYDDDSMYDEQPGKDLLWLLPRESRTRIKSHYIAYGNDASFGTIYGDLVLIATVPPKSQRGV